MTIESTASRKRFYPGVRYTLTDFQVLIQEASAELKHPTTTIVFDVDDEKFRTNTAGEISTLAASLPSRLRSIGVTISDADSRLVSFSISNLGATLSVDGSSRTWVRGTIVGLDKNIKRHQWLLYRGAPTSFIALLAIFCSSLFGLSFRHEMSWSGQPSAAESALMQAKLMSDPIGLALVSVSLLSVVFFMAAMMVTSYVIVKPSSKWLQAPEWVFVGVLVAIATLVVTIILNR